MSTDLEKYDNKRKRQLKKELEIYRESCERDAAVKYMKDMQEKLSYRIKIVDPLTSSEFWVHKGARFDNGKIVWQ